jgi:N-methylhydantoinase B
VSGARMQVEKPHHEMTANRKATAPGTEQKLADPALLAIIANRLETVVREMINTLLRTSRSGVLNTARDFSCAIITSDNRLLVFAESLPVHVAAIALEGRAMTELHAGTLRPGDAFLNNSPYHGGTHHADHTILVPVFFGDRHVMTVCAKAHQADTGNASPTTYAPRSRDIYEEGSVNLPCVRAQRDYEDVADIVRMCQMRIRVPDQWYGDFLAGVGAARIGERLIVELYEKYGAEALDGFVEEWLDYSERRMVEELRGLPAGTWHGQTFHDPFPGVPDGVPVNVRIDIDPADARLTLDLRDNVDNVPNGLNLSESTSRSAALIGVFNSLDPDIPINDGSLRRVDVLLREGGVVGIPRHPASCSTATTNVADRLVNVVSATMATIRPEYGQAEGGLGIPASRAVISGEDPRRADARYINQIFLGNTGGPATSDCDGWVTFIVPVSGGFCYRDSVEIDEQKYPIVVRTVEVLADSGGGGRFQGGPATLVEFGPATASPVRVVYSSDGHHFPAGGVLGGLDGSACTVEQIDAEGRVSELPLVADIELQPGNWIRARTCGGGGYGDPRERSDELVRRDLEEGLITRACAERVYGFSPAVEQTAVAAR